MLKMSKVEDLKVLSGSALEKYLTEKADTMMKEYSVDDLDNIGCFVILDKTEYPKFDISKMEFVEVVHIGNEVYLHGVKITGDSYGEDVYLTIGAVEC